MPLATNVSLILIGEFLSDTLLGGILLDPGMRPLSGDLAGIPFKTEDYQVESALFGTRRLRLGAPFDGILAHETFPKNVYGWSADKLASILASIAADKSITKLSADIQSDPFDSKLWFYQKPAEQQWANLSIVWVAHTEIACGLSFTPKETGLIVQSLLSAPEIIKQNLSKKVASMSNYAASFWSHSAKALEAEGWTRGEIIDFIVKNRRTPFRIEEEIKSHQPVVTPICGQHIPVEYFILEKPSTDIVILAKEYPVKGASTYYVDISARINPGKIHALATKDGYPDTVPIDYLLSTNDYSMIVSQYKSSQQPRNAHLDGVEKFDMKPYMLHGPIDLWLERAISILRKPEGDSWIKTAVFSHLSDLEMRTGVTWSLQEVSILYDALCLAVPNKRSVGVANKISGFKAEASPYKDIVQVAWPTTSRSYGFIMTKEFAKNFPAMVLVGGKKLPSVNTVAKSLGLKQHCQDHRAER